MVVMTLRTHWLSSDAVLSRALDSRVYRLSLFASFIISIPMWLDNIVDLSGMVYNSNYCFKSHKASSSSSKSLFEEHRLVSMVALMSISLVNLILFLFSQQTMNKTLKGLIPAIITSQFFFLVMGALVGINHCSNQQQSKKNDIKRRRKKTARVGESAPAVWIKNNTTSPVEFAEKTKYISFLGTMVAVVVNYFSATAPSSSSSQHSTNSHNNASAAAKQSSSALFICGLSCAVAVKVWMLYNFSKWIQYRRTFFPTTGKAFNANFWAFLLYFGVYVVVTYIPLVLWAVAGFANWDQCSEVVITVIVWLQVAIMLVLTILPAKILNHGQQPDSVRNR
jgi:hypothetical protein